MVKGEKKERYGQSSQDGKDSQMSNHLNNSQQMRVSVPFELARSMLSTDRKNSQCRQKMKSATSNKQSREPGTSLAQKMNHMVTADNDLSRKSVTSVAAFYE